MRGATSAILAVAIMAAAGSSASAQPPDAAVACIFAGVDPAAMRTAILLNSRGSTPPPTAVEAAAQDQVQKKAQACRKRHRWTSAQYEGAFSYAAGRAAYEIARRTLVTRKVDPAILDQAAARLAPSDREAMLKGDATPALPILLELLQASGMDLEQGTGAEWESLGEVLGEGLAGLLLRERGLFLYNGR